MTRVGRAFHLWASGAVLVIAGALAYFVVRGPVVPWPTSAGGAIALLLATHVLSELSRLAAVATRWGLHAVFAADPFCERRAVDLLDEVSPHRLSSDVIARLQDSARRLFQAELPSVARTDDEARRDEKAERIEALLDLARARALVHPVAGPALAAAEVRAEAARALTAALALAAAGVLALAIHDLAFARAVAHAASGFTVLGAGLALVTCALAAFGFARASGRAASRETLLLIIGEGGAPGGPG